MNILSELELFISEFNKNNDEDFAIDSIRIEFSKQHKKDNLDKLGNWNKIHTKDRKILAKLKKRLTADEVTSAYQLENYNIYYYNSSTPPKYNKATMVIFAMKQYHRAPPPHNIVETILNILSFGTSKIDINIDLCLDFPYKPNLNKLKERFTLKPYITKYGEVTDTSYINHPNITMIEKIVIYNKQLKNNLNFLVWRVEAKILIPNIRLLALPLYEFKKEVVDLMKKPQVLVIANQFRQGGINE